MFIQHFNPLATKFCFVYRSLRDSLREALIVYRHIDAALMNFFRIIGNLIRGETNIFFI